MGTPIPDFDQKERSRIAENARRKLEANKVINHPDSMVFIQPGKVDRDGVTSLIITVYQPPEA